MRRPDLTKEQCITRWSKTLEAVQKNHKGSLQPFPGWARDEVILHCKAMLASIEEDRILRITWKEIDGHQTGARIVEYDKKDPSVIINENVEFNGD